MLKIIANFQLFYVYMMIQQDDVTKCPGTKSQVEHCVPLMMRPMDVTSLRRYVPDRCFLTQNRIKIRVRTCQDKSFWVMLGGLRPPYITPLYILVKVCPAASLQANLTYPRRVSECPNVKGPSVRDASARYTSSKGHVVQGTLCPRDGTSETFCLGTHWSGTR